MIDKIRNFLNQFDFEPIIENYESFKNLNKYVICGMGGSHLAGDILKFIFPDIDLIIHKNYGLPEIKDLNERTIICISFSGNTEETIDAFEKARERSLNILVISQNGKILELAKVNNIPYIKIPDDDIPPRLGVGYMLKALLKIFGFSENFEDIKKEIDVFSIENKAQKLLEEIGSKTIFLYTTEEIFSLAPFWKACFNENSKNFININSFPELCHNEIEIFENENKIKKLKPFVLFLIANDIAHSKNLKRIDIFKKILEEKKIPYESISFKGNKRLSIALKNILFALFLSYYDAISNNIDPVSTDLIERIKKEIKGEP